MTLCDEVDCFLHPEYEYPKKEEKTVFYDEHTHTHQIGQIHHAHDGTLMVSNGITWQNIEVGQLKEESGLRVRLERLDLEIPIECTMCKYRKQIDMKELLLVTKAKRLLEGKEE